MRLLIIFIFFAVIDYALRTFIDSYKYHTVGLFIEFLPLIIATLLSVLIYFKTISKGHFGWSYLKLITVSILGLLTAKTILFIQWYWVIAPQYRNIQGDMNEGLSWTLLFLLIDSILIALSYLIVILIIKSSKKLQQLN